MNGVIEYIYDSSSNNCILNRQRNMILRQALRVCRQFSRIVKPNMSKYNNVFEIMRERNCEIRSIMACNQQALNSTIHAKPQQQFSKDLGISEKAGQEAIARTVIDSVAYTPSQRKSYRITQKLKGKVEVQDDDGQVEGLYNPGHLHLKSHYSIDGQVANLREYKLNKSTVYIFNLPEWVTEGELAMEIGEENLESIKLHYCMLGLPAYAVLQFSSASAVEERFGSKGLNIEFKNKVMKVVTAAEKHKCPLHRRQLAFRGLPPGETPASMLERLSEFGRVVGLSLPMEVYREQSLAEVKQLYKQQNEPIKLNLHRKNGTIESEYYPPFEPTSPHLDPMSQKQEEYNRRLRYCENVDIFEDSEGGTKTRAKGFCIVTYSCQEEAQNCYFHFRNVLKMELVNGREEFEFDRSHYEGILRFVDNQFIEACKRDNPRKEITAQYMKQNSLIFQSIFLTLAYQQIQKIGRTVPAQVAISETAKPEYQKMFEVRFWYKNYLRKLKESIGKSRLNGADSSGNNMYGKSFDELAEEELFGMKLTHQNEKERYEVNLDEYIPKTEMVLGAPPEVPEQSQEEREEGLQKKRKQKEAETQVARKRKKVDTRRSYLRLKKQKNVINKSTFAGGIAISIGGGAPGRPSKAKKKFSTVRQPNPAYRSKTFEEKVSSQARYNRFLRDTINEYMGIFPLHKLQSQFTRTKATFLNPQSLKFIDGEQFLTQSQLPHILQFSARPSQDHYDKFVQDNEIVKSLNLDIEKVVLKNMEERMGDCLHYYSDVGVVVEEYPCTNDDNPTDTLNKLNRQAQFGYAYKLVTKPDKSQAIVKITKLEHIYPLDLIQKYKENVEKIKKQQFCAEDHEFCAKYFEYFFNGEPMPNQMAKELGMQPGEVFNTAELVEDMCQMFGHTKKDIEKLMNIKHYQKEEIRRDVAKQMEIAKSRQKMEAKSAEDYSKDPSRISVKDKEGKAVVSKFRQI